MAKGTAAKGKRRARPKNRAKVVQPPWWRRISGRALWLTLFSLLSIVVVGLYLRGERAMVEPLEIEPVMVRNIQLSGLLEHVSSQQIRELVQVHGVDGILALDTEQLRLALEALPWVYQARVRKVWPDQLALSVEEQRAVVRWGDQGYLNLDGEFFLSDGVALKGMTLPLILSEQEDTVAVYQQLKRLQQILSVQEPAPEILAMVVDSRGAISLTLDTPLKIHLGRRASEDRLRRWVEQAATLRQQYQGRLSGVDLRYERGLVLQLKQQPKKK